MFSSLSACLLLCKMKFRKRANSPFNETWQEKPYKRDIMKNLVFCPTHYQILSLGLGLCRYYSIPLNRNTSLNYASEIFFIFEEKFHCKVDCRK